MNMNTAGLFVFTKFAPGAKSAKVNVRGTQGSNDARSMVNLPPALALPPSIGPPSNGPDTLEDKKRKDF